MKKIIVLLLILLFPIIVLGTITGDVDGDGKVGASDYILIRKHILKQTTLTGDLLKKADVNGDGKLTSIDYITIRKIIINGPTPEYNRIHFISGDTSYTYNGTASTSYNVNDSILLESNGKYAMIDMNTPYNYGKYVKPYLKQLGVKELEFVVITHLHSDHYGGLISYLSEENHDFKIKRVYYKADCLEKSSIGTPTYSHNCFDKWIDDEIEVLKNNLSKQGIENVNPEKVTNSYYDFTFGEMSISLTNLSYVTQTHDWDNENIMSIVTLITIPKSDGSKYRVLSLGDSYIDSVNTAAANKLTNNGTYKIDVLKAEHHGISIISENFAKASAADNIVITGTCKRSLYNPDTKWQDTNVLEYYSQANPNSKFYFVNNTTNDNMKDKYNRFNYNRGAIIADFGQSITFSNVNLDNGNLTSADFLPASKVSKYKYEDDSNTKIKDLCE